MKTDDIIHDLSAQMLSRIDAALIDNIGLTADDRSAVRLGAWLDLGVRLLAVEQRPMYGATDNLTRAALMASLFKKHARKTFSHDDDTHKARPRDS